MPIIGRLTKSAPDGEKKLYRLFSAFLPLASGNTFIYYQPQISDKIPDFLVLAPDFGVLIIEVKDYKPASILSVHHTQEWNYLGNNKLVRNPFEQMYHYEQMLRIRFTIEKLSSTTESPLSSVIVFPLISVKDMISQDLIQIANPNYKLLFKEDLKNIETFQRALYELHRDFHLKPNEIIYLRGRLIPTSRLPHPHQKKIFNYDQIFPSDVILKVFDEEQEEFAYNLGEGHRLVFGVAGSGKTILLIARADLLARKHPGWRILILCYNKLLAKYLYQHINPSSYKDTNIVIYHFHSWAKHLIRGSTAILREKYLKEEERIKEGKEATNVFFNETVPKLLMEAVSTTTFDKYDAILIDEAQDFEKVWLEPVIKMLNPTTNSLLIACDGLQGIYARKKFYWKDIGIEARGRVKKFHRTYRNPAKVGKTAYGFIIRERNFEELILSEDEFLETTEFARRGGIVDIQVVDNNNVEEEIIIHTCVEYYKKSWSILILFARNPEKLGYLPLLDSLRGLDVSCFFLNEKTLGEAGIYIGTLQGTKGLEADFVILLGLNTISDNIINRQLLYVGMTRALQGLLVISTEETSFITELYDILGIHPSSKIINEILEGKRCYYCSQPKKSGKDKPLCYECWIKLVNGEICSLCGKSVSYQSLNVSNPILNRCSECVDQIFSECQICHTTKKPEQGNPLCYRCYNTLHNAWLQIDRSRIYFSSPI